MYVLIDERSFQTVILIKIHHYGRREKKYCNIKCHLYSAAVDWYVLYIIYNSVYTGRSSRPWNKIVPSISRTFLRLPIISFAIQYYKRGAYDCRFGKNMIFMYTIVYRMINTNIVVSRGLKNVTKTSTASYSHRVYAEIVANI